MAGVFQVGCGFIQGGMLSSFYTFIVWILKKSKYLQCLAHLLHGGAGEGQLSSSARLWDALGRGLRKRGLFITEALLPQEMQ